MYVHASVPNLCIPPYTEYSSRGLDHVAFVQSTVIRSAISHRYAVVQGLLSNHTAYGSGATPVRRAVQDPSYPVYVDTSVISGNTGDYNEGASGFDGLEYMVCNPENDFFPDLEKTAKTGVLHDCWTILVSLMPRLSTCHWHRGSVPACPPFVLVACARHLSSAMFA